MPTATGATDPAASPEQSAALEGLANMLAEVQADLDPVAEAIEALTVEDVERLLHAMPLRERRHTLDILRIPVQGTKIHKALCRDVLNRIRRTSGPRHAAVHLTHPVLDDMARAIPDADRWSPTVLRLTMWVQFGSTPGSSPMWVWALEQPWMAETIGRSPDLLEAARHAAETLAPTSAEQNEDAVQEAGHDPTDAVDRSEDLPDTPEAAENLAATVQNVADTLAEAGEASRRIAAAIAAKARPADEDLQALVAVADAFDAALLQFREHGVSPEHTDLAELEQALAVAKDHLTTVPLRTRLRRITRLACTDDNAGLAVDLDVARSRAEALCDTQTWGTNERQDADALCALLTMVELHADGRDLSEIHSWLSVAVKSRAVAYLAGRYAELTLTAPESRDPSTPVETHEADETDKPHRIVGPIEQPSREDDKVATAARPTKPQRAEPSAEPRVPARRGAAAALDDNARPEAHPVHQERSGVSRGDAVPPPRAAEHTPSVDVPVEPTVLDRSNGYTPGTNHSESANVLAELVASERYGLAGSLAEALGESPTLTAALQLAACAESVRSSSSAGVETIRKILDGAAWAAPAARRADAALATAALLRTVLVTGDPQAGAVLAQVAGGLPPVLVHVANEVADRALQSLLLHSPPLALARDRAELERALEEARDECRRGLQPPHIRFVRGREIVRHWWNPDKGLIGSLLRHAVDDDRSDLTAVARRIEELNEPATLQVELDKIDRVLMSSGSRSRLEGPARQDLLRHTTERLSAVGQWVRRARELGMRDVDWSADQVQEMRATVLALRDEVLDSIRGQFPGTSGLTVSVLEATVSSLTRTFALLSGESRPKETEPPVELVLHGELLKIPGTVVRPEGVVPPPGISADELARAGRRSWHEAVELHLDSDQFATAQKIVDLWVHQRLPGTRSAAVPSSELQARIRDRGQAVEQELAEKRRVLDEELRRTRVDGALNEERERALERRLQNATPAADDDLALVRLELESVENELAEARTSHADALRSRLDEVRNALPDERHRVGRLIDDGDLLTAEDLISHLDNGESIPDTRTVDESLATFFPDVPEALSKTGVSAALIKAVRGRERFQHLAALDYSALSPELAEQTAQALEGWADLAARKDNLRTHGVRESELLMPALRLIGYSSKKGPQRVENPRNRSFRFLDLPEVRHGTALVPAFGSGLRGTLRVMLVWDRPSAETLMSWIQQDPNDDSLLVVYFGTMSVRNRVALAAQSVNQRRAVVVLDDAALAHLAACGNLRLDSAMRVLLPFSAVNPYVMGKRAPVPEEMFFGRSEEVSSLQSPTGDQVVFGGRGLGKSALLKAAGRKYEAQMPGARLSLLLSLDSTFTGTNAPSSTVWDRIGRRLLESDALKLPRKVKADSVLAYDQVLAGIRGWLGEDGKRMLLIMLDEADGFFESDSPQFTETRRLRDLGADTDQRVKVVFAGLHSVQRYATIAVNSPFSHLAQSPRVIGPLRPQDAVNLLMEPLGVLGYRFASSALVHRILGHCSYQPFLLQMFGHRLVQAMHAKRRNVESGPPYAITREVVQAVQSDKDLRHSITEAFHDTLRLDSRYNVIANVVAYHAHHHGLAARLTQAQLLDECKYFWPAGFNDLDTDQFRAYLAEMEGLGVLAPDSDHRGWHLRSANALSMIGNLSRVEAELEQAPHRQVAERFAQLEARHQSPTSHSHSPLTAHQVAALLPKQGNHAHLVIGTPATGVDRVSLSLCEIAEQGGWEVPHIGRSADFTRELTSGKPGQRRVVVADLTVKSPSEQRCLETVDEAVHRIPLSAGVTRSAVVVAGLDQQALWNAAFATGADGGRDVELLSLRRFSPEGLRAWTQDKEVFTSEEELGRLRTATGGWPLLLDNLAVALASGRDANKALGDLTARLQDVHGADAFLHQVGLVPKSPQWTAYQAILGFMDDDGLPADDLHAAIEADTDSGQVDAALCVDLLQALQVFDVDAALGTYRPEPVVRGCWERVRGG
ncbi:hypothetical protein [Yinghuangia sp. YIM S10712]|uniref:hypothetical protein n=1 Tax=Yinghuangia sp. YIM S10712 TaxID=3436930 RepID=UPI003F53898C